jgi:hypothetical protein
MKLIYTEEQSARCAQGKTLGSPVNMVLLDDLLEVVLRKNGNTIWVNFSSQFWWVRLVVDPRDLSCREDDHLGHGQIRRASIPPPSNHTHSHSILLVRSSDEILYERHLITLAEPKHLKDYSVLTQHAAFTCKVKI